MQTKPNEPHSHKPDAGHDLRNLIKCIPRQSAEQPHSIPGVFAKLAQDGDSFSRGLECVSRMRTDPECVLKIKEYKAHGTVFIAWKQSVDIEGRD